MLRFPLGLVGSVKVRFLLSADPNRGLIGDVNRFSIIVGRNCTNVPNNINMEGGLASYLKKYK